MLIHSPAASPAPFVASAPASCPPLASLPVPASPVPASPVPASPVLPSAAPPSSPPGPIVQLGVLGMFAVTACRLRKYATISAAAAASTPASAKCGIGGQSGCPSLSIPLRNAFWICALVQQPRPVAGSGVRLGG